MNWLHPIKLQIACCCGLGLIPELARHHSILSRFCYKLVEDINVARLKLARKVATKGLICMISLLFFLQQQ